MVEKALYRHYKGGMYFVTGSARCTETGTILIIYYGEDHQVWARPKEMFVEKVNVNGELVQRFKKV